MGERKDVSFRWLRDFFTASVSYFDGSGRYGRADDFLEALLLTPPSVKRTEDGKMGLVDPLGIAEEIISTRGEVVYEWKGVVSNASDEHIGLKKALFSKQISSSSRPTDTKNAGFE